MFNNSLKTRLVTYTVVLILLIALSFLAFYVYQMSNLVEDQLVEFGFHLGEDLSFSAAEGVATGSPALIQPALQDSLKEEQVLLAAVYDRRADSIISSRKEEIAPEIASEVKQRLLRRKEPIKVAGETEQGVRVYNFYVPVRVEREQQSTLVGFSRVVVSLEKIAVQRREIFKFGGAATLLVTLVVSLLAYLIAVRITRPIRSLTRGAEEISKGNLDHRIETETQGETKELAKTFNQMAENLQQSRERLKEAKKSLEIQVEARTKELRELNQQLEKRVHKRTRELQKRVNELERFHRLTVGREMRMVELKDKIKELKEKLKQAGEDED